MNNIRVTQKQIHVGDVQIDFDLKKRITKSILKSLMQEHGCGNCIVVKVMEYQRESWKDHNGRVDMFECFNLTDGKVVKERSFRKKCW